MFRTWVAKTDRFVVDKKGIPQEIKMNSLKQVIVNAVVKVSEDPMYANREYETSQLAREDFIKALIAELFPECPDFVLPSAEQASEVRSYREQNATHYAAAMSAVRAEIRRGARKEEPAAAGSGEPEQKEEADGGGEPVKEKKKRAPKKKAEAPAAAGAGEPVAEPEKKKAGRKPKAAAAGPQNLDKWNPAQTNHFKTIAKELKVDGDKKAFQAHVNAMSKEEFDAVTFDEHVRRFLTPIPVVEEVTLTKCARVEWLGEEYLVDPETQKVYKPDTDGNKHVGHVGMLEFEGMELPTA